MRATNVQTSRRRAWRSETLAGYRAGQDLKTVAIPRVDVSDGDRVLPVQDRPALRAPGGTQTAKKITNQIRDALSEPSETSSDALEAEKLYLRSSSKKLQMFGDIGKRRGDNWHTELNSPLRRVRRTRG